MALEKRQYAVNWQPGMKVRTDHFIALENWVVESIQDATAGRMDAYGVLPVPQAQESSVKLQPPVLSGNEIFVILRACRIVTAGGLLFIRYEDENRIPGIGTIEGKYKQDSGTKENLNIILSITPFSRIPIGDPADEIPPRRPYTTQQAVLKIQAHSTVWNPLFELKVGEIVYEGETPVLSKEYVPPCTHMNSHPVLMEKYGHWSSLLGALHQHSLTAYRKLHRAVPAGLDAVFNESLKSFCQQLTFFLANNLSWYQLVLPTASPRLWIEFFVRFSRVIYTTLEGLQEGTKEKLLDNFQRWGSNFMPGPFNEALVQVMNTAYDHEALFPALQRVDRMMTILTALFERLNQMDFIPIRQY